MYVLLERFLLKIFDSTGDYESNRTLVLSNEKWVHSHFMSPMKILSLIVGGKCPVDVLPVLTDLEQSHVHIL